MRRLILLAVLVTSLLVPVVVLTAVGLGALRRSTPDLAAPAVPVPAPATQPPQPTVATGQLVSVEWASATGAAAGIPAPAMRAYGHAELVLAGEAPKCRLGWPTLAGIGWVESHHGTIGGRTLAEDGRSSRPVLGPELDGEKYAAIAPTESSRKVHGNDSWDHAVGPLQFIGKSWDRWGADGDGDGKADPLDLDDAALAAARYLCADRHDLRTAAGWTAAIRSYNHSDDYVRAVHAAADAYVTRAVGG